MKKIYLFLMTAAAGVSAVAQQLPGADFEQSWVKCYPWYANKTDKEQGTTPSPWNVANTIGTGSLGATSVGTQINGYSGKGVKVSNTSVLMGNVIPGYFTLGTPWSTAVGMSANNKDGGTFGGVEFTNRPDAMSFYYQSTTSTDQPTVVAYSWKGTYTQESVPANIVLTGSASKVAMTDRDRNILGMSTSQGGAVTAQGTRISLINTRLIAAQSTWKQEVLPFEYSSTDKPEKINVIFSAGDYFNSSPVKSNSLSIDEVKLLYYSRLASLSVNGAAVAGFASDKYEYDLSDVEMPSVDAVAYTFLGTSGMQNATVSTEGNVMKITVANANEGTGVEDVDGASTHVYTLTFKAAEVGEMPAYAKGYFDGNISVSFNSFDDENASVLPDYTLNVTQMENDLSKCIISIPDFYIMEKPEDETDEEAMAVYEAARVGDIVVNNVTWTEVAGGCKFYGVEPNLSLSLSGTDIVARVVVNGTIDDSGKCVLNIDVIWLSDDGDVPIFVSFNGERNVAGIDSVMIDNSNYPVEYYNINGMRVNGDNLKSGIYIIRQGKDVKKILVK